MKFLFGRRPSQSSFIKNKGDVPSLASSSDSSSKSECGDSEAAVLSRSKIPHSSSSSSVFAPPVMTALVVRKKSSSSAAVAAATTSTSTISTAGTTATSPTASPTITSTRKQQQQQVGGGFGNSVGLVRSQPPLTPIRKKGYSAVAELKVDEKTASTNAVSSSTSPTLPKRGRFGFVRMVSRIRTPSFSALSPKEETTITFYSPPPAQLLPVVVPPTPTQPVASAAAASPQPAEPPVEARPSSPTVEFMKKLFGSTNTEQQQQQKQQQQKQEQEQKQQQQPAPKQKPKQIPKLASPGGTNKSSFVKARSVRPVKVKVTVEDGSNKKAAPPPRLLLPQLQHKSNLQPKLESPPPLEENQQQQQQDKQQQEKQQQQQQQKSPSPQPLAVPERRVRYRDEVSEISAKGFYASFIYGDDDDDDDDFNDETSRSVATGTSSASYVSDKSGATGDSLFTDLSGYTSTATDATSRGTSYNSPTQSSSTRRTFHRFGFYRCGSSSGVDSAVDDDVIGGGEEVSTIQPQCHAEDIVEDVKSVLTELVRDILCLGKPPPPE